MSPRRSADAQEGVAVGQGELWGVGDVRSRITDACAPNATDDGGVGYHERGRWRIVAGEEM